MRVLFLIAEYRPVVGGAEIQAERLATALATRGVEMEVLTRRPRRLRNTEVVDGVTVYRVWGPGHGRWKMLGQTAAMLRFLRTRRGYDILHAHQALYPAYVAVAVGRARRIPIVVKPGNVGSRFDLSVLKNALPLGIGRHMANAIANGATRLIALNERMRAELEAWGVSAERIADIPNGVPVREQASPARRTAARRRLGLEGSFDDGVLVCTASLTPKKDHSTLLRAMSRLADSDLRPLLLLVGDGPRRRALEAMTAELGLVRQVRFEGWRSVVWDYLYAADCFVLCSTVEGLSNALLEAMSIGLPCVASDAPGNRDLLDDGVAGQLYRARDDSALAARLRIVLGDQVVAERLGRAARLTVESRYSIERVAEQYHHLYCTLLNDRSLDNGSPRAALEFYRC